MIREHRFALALIFVVGAVVFLPPLIKGEVFVVRDHLDYFQPLRWFTAGELKAGRLPLWNPYSASGEPWLANPQSGVFYPPCWIFLALPFPAAYMSFLLLHLLILGWGSYLLFSRTASPGAAMVGAVAVMFAGPTLSLLDVNNNLATLAWLPVVLWCAAQRAWRRGALALTLAFLGGEPFFAAMSALMFAMVAVAGGSARVVALSGMGAFGLSAVQLFPFLEAIRSSDRASGLPAQSILRESMPLGDWLRIALPFSDGRWDAKLGQQFIPVIYVGIVVVALAVAGLASIRQRHVAGWVALLVFSVAVGAGPPFLAALPLTLFRYPARLVPLGALAIVGLAVAGWERLRPANRRWVDLLLVLAVAGDLLLRGRPLLETAPFTTDVVPYRQEIGSDTKFAAAGEVLPSQRPYWISGYLNLYDRRFDANTAAPFQAERYRRFYAEVLRTGEPSRLAFLSIGYVLASEAMPPGFVPIVRYDRVTTYRNPTVWPMARLVTKRGIYPAQWAMDTRSARITVDAPEPGVVVLAQQLVPGWEVAVDGEPAEVKRSERLFRGVAVTKGRHEIVWRYRPRSLAAGAIVTMVTTLLIVFSFLVKTARRRNFFLPVTRKVSSRIATLQRSPLTRSISKW